MKFDEDGCDGILVQNREYREGDIGHQRGIERAGVKVSAKRAEEAADGDFSITTLVCICSPSYEWHPPKPMEDLLKMKINNYENKARSIYASRRFRANARACQRRRPV